MWSDFESDVVEGRYRLDKLVRSEGRCAWYESRFDEKPALISLTESLNDESSLLKRLQAAEKVRHPNVMTILETGSTALQDTPLVYAVMEFTEENLEDVLRTRALSVDEAREVAESLVSALSAIHKAQLVCGRLEAANVLAAGDTIKLRSDHLQVVPPDGSFNSLAAKDVQDLGVVLYRCLTQRLPKQATDGNDPSLQLLPPPFVQIVRKALGEQATVEEIAALLRPAVAAPIPPAVMAAKPVQPPAAPKPVPKSPVFWEKKQIPVPERPTGRKRSPLILAGFVLLLIVVGFVLWAILHATRHSTAASGQEAKRVVVIAPAAPVPAPRSAQTNPPVPKKPVPTMPAASRAAAVPLATRPSAVWRVVAYTYNRQDQAEHKVRTISDKYPDLQAEVFSPKGGAPYLVTLGGAMDREAAFQLREKAIQEGLPQDTYAQNYSH